MNSASGHLAEDKMGGWGLRFLAIVDPELRKVSETVTKAVTVRIDYLQSTLPMYLRL